MVKGVPWSWKINGYSITHENDQAYLVETPKGFYLMKPLDYLIATPKGLRILTPKI